MAKGNHSFTEQDIRKRFGAIVGHTVAEVDTAGVLAASKASRNKGRIGTGGRLVVCGLRHLYQSTVASAGIAPSTAAYSVG